MRQLVLTLKQIELLSMLPQLSLRKRAHLRAMHPEIIRADTLPVGYSRRTDGIICQITINEDGTHNHEPICRYAFFDGYLEEYPTYTLSFSTTLETGRTTHISAPVEALSDKNSMCRWLGKQGVALQDAETKRVKEFFMSWIKTLQETKKVVTTTPYGWSIDNKSNVDGFVYGGNLWSPTG